VKCNIHCEWKNRGKKSKTVNPKCFVGLFNRASIGDTT